MPTDEVAFIQSMVRPGITKLSPYCSARGEVASSSLCLLDANESPLSGNRLFQGEDDNRYPEPQPLELLSQMAKLYGLEVDQLLLTRGIDEGLDIVFRTFCEPGKDNVIIHPPTYGYYQVCAAIQGCEVLHAQLRKDFSLDPDLVLKIRNNRTKIVILCNPNNPTGNLLSSEAIRELAQALQSHCLLLIDEAYIEFSETDSFVPCLSRYPNVIVMRTFSKAWGLAGVRLGLTLAHPEVIRTLKKVLAPYPISRPALRILGHALREGGQSFMRERVERLGVTRQALAKSLAEIPKVRSLAPSSANFILFKVDDPKKLVDDLRKQGISIRDRSADVPGCVRVSIGSDRENDFLLQQLRDLLQ